MAQRKLLDTPATCVIQIQGTLGSHWSDYFGGLEITIKRDQDTVITTLSGPVMDQAALLGTLNNLYNLGFPLLFVACHLVQQEGAS